LLIRDLINIFILIKMSNMEKYTAQFDDIIKKIDIRLRNETYKDPDVANKTVNDSKTLLTSAKKLVYNFININID